MKRRVNIEIQKARSTRRQEEKSMNLELEKRWIITQQRQRHKSHIQAHLLLAVDISSPVILSWAIPCAFRSWSMHLLISTLVSLPLPHALYFPCFGLLSRFELLAQFTVASVFDSNCAILCIMLKCCGGLIWADWTPVQLANGSPWPWCKTAFKVFHFCCTVWS